MKKHNEFSCLDKLYRTFNTRYDSIIRDYVDRINKAMGIQEEHPWMREDVLESSLYSCTIAGYQVKLRDMLFGAESVRTKQNVILIVGEKHIGKRYFVKRLFNICQIGIKERAVSKKLPGDAVGYRIPVLIHSVQPKISLTELIADAIESECRSTASLSAQEKAYLTKLVGWLLRQGKFLIYFRGWSQAEKLDEELQEILQYGRITDYAEDAKYHNLVVFTADSDIKDTFLNDNNRTLIQLKRLTVDEVTTYLEKYSSGMTEIVKCEEKIMEILRYPGNLRMFESLYMKELTNNMRMDAIKNIFDFYDYFLWANIVEQLQNSKAERSSSQRVKIILSDLQTFAFNLYLYGKRVENQSSRFFPFSDFVACGILEENTESEKDFVFPVCGYFLAAKQLLVKLREGSLNEIPTPLVENPLEIILLWAGRMIDDEEVFARFWQLVVQTHCKLLLRAKIAYDCQFSSHYIGKVYEEAFVTLQEEFYDYSALEVFNELDGKGESYDSGSYLKIRYVELDQAGEPHDEIQRVNIKKRSVYYLGISHKGISSKMLEELMKEGTDLHLKYHIIRAIVECYDTDLKTKDLIDRNYEELKQYCEDSDDPIIMSDFSVLYRKVNLDGVTPFMSAKESDMWLKRLTDTLEDKTYWKRAHAAGALGRRSGISKHHEDLLVNHIKKELQRIYNHEGEGYEFRNSIKVISYSVEAICEISDLNLNCRSAAKEQTIRQLVEMLDIDRLGDQDIEDAYATIATGIEFLISADTQKLPFNLGGRFRNRMINHQKVLQKVFQAMGFLQWEDETEMLVNQKQKEMEAFMERNRQDSDQQGDISRRIRILQLSDFHIKEKSTRNTLMIDLVCDEVKNIDILVITGDLKQYGKTYDQTLVVLKELTERLGLQPKDVFMVPGNHDCEAYDHKAEFIQKIRDGFYNDEDCYQDYLDNLDQGFNAYREFLQKFYGDALTPQGGIHNQLFSWENRLHILTMNTSLLCDEESSKDKLVDTYELALLRGHEDTTPTICISHHPLSKLYLDHQQTVSHIFRRLRVSALLSGDIHRSIVEYICLNPETIPNYICGKFQGERGDSWSTYNIAIYEVDLEERKLTPRLFKFEGHDLKPDQSFSKRPDGIEGNWIPLETTLL